MHICTNETIGGVEFHWTPDTGAVPLVADMSSHILSRPLDVTKYGLIYAGAQKNIGPAGLVRGDRARGPDRPGACRARPTCSTTSCRPTPTRCSTRRPPSRVYLAGLTFKWLLERGGLAAHREGERRARPKLLYGYLDSQDFYSNPVAKEDRSRMNVPFTLRDASLDARLPRRGRGARACRS